jgi:hypothetical protein
MPGQCAHWWLRFFDIVTNLRNGLVPQVASPSGVVLAIAAVRSDGGLSRHALRLDKVSAD